MTPEKANGSVNPDFDKGWKASEAVTKLIRDYMAVDRTDDERHGFESGMLYVFPHGVLLDEIGLRLSEVKDDDDTIDLS